MFTEILRVKPVLDPASAKKMESSLNTRFSRIAKRFGGGLMSALKASVLGLSLGLLNRLLNPIEALETKIKTLLGQGTEIRDMAEEFNTSPGEIKRLQDVAGSIGVAPDQLNGMLTQYAKAVEEARLELRDPTKERSASTRAVENFVGEENLAEGFFKFLSSLRKEGQGQGRSIQIGESGRETRQISGVESRQDFERAVFGESLKGASRRLVETDLSSQLEAISEPTAQELTQAVDKLANLEQERKVQEIRNQTRDFIKASGVINSQTVTDLESAAAREADRDTKQLNSYGDLRKAADGIEIIKNELMTLSAVATKGLGYLGTGVSVLKQSRSMRDVRNGDPVK